MTGNEKNTDYTLTDIEKYLNGELTPSQMHALEKASMEDPFLGDALAGMRNDRLERNTGSFHADLQELEERLREKILEKNRRSLPWLRGWRVAAAVVVLAGFGILSYFGFTGSKVEKQALATTTTHKDSPKAGSVASPSVAEADGSSPRQSGASDSSRLFKDKFTADQTAEKKGDTAGTKNEVAAAKSRGAEANSKVAESRGEAAKANLVADESRSEVADVVETGNKKVDFKKISTDQQFLTKPYTTNRKATDYKNSVAAKDDLAVTSPGPARIFKNKLSARPLTTIDTLHFTPAALASTGYLNTFKGKVLTPEGKPLAFASVTLKDQPASVFTDSVGFFNLLVPGPDTVVNVTISSKGYAALSTVLRNNNFAGHINANFRSVAKNHNDLYGDKIDEIVGYSNEIRLRPQSDMGLKEIATNNYHKAKSRKKTVSPLLTETEAAEKLTDSSQGMLSKDLEPSGGWVAYDQYLENNKKITTADSIFTGIEIISFVVGQKGRLSSFRVEQSLSDSHDAEAKRLIKQGPPWKLLKNKKERMTLRLHF